MTSPVNIPDVPPTPHTIHWTRYARELLALSGVPTHSDDPAHEIWQRLDHALTQIEARLTRGRDEHESAGQRLNLKGWPARSIAALAEHFASTRSAIVRQFLRQCPVESFPDGWVAEDTRLIAERRAHLERIIYEQFHHAEEVP